jgi:hypothetical protein
MKLLILIEVTLTILLLFIWWISYMVYNFNISLHISFIYVPFQCQSLNYPSMLFPFKFKIIRDTLVSWSVKVIWIMGVFFGHDINLIRAIFVTSCYPDSWYLVTLCYFDSCYFETWHYLYLCYNMMLSLFMFLGGMTIS